MARGGLSYGGIGAKNAPFEAGTALKAIVNAAGKTRDDIVGLPVVKTSVSNVVDIGTAGDVLFGFVDTCEQKISQDNLYANEVYVGVQIRGFREGIAAGASDIVGKVCILDGTDQKKVNGATNVGIKQKMTKTVTHVASTAGGDITIKVTAAGKAELVEGKNVTVTLEKDDAVATIATKIKTALLADDDVAAFFDVTTSIADVILTAKVAVANDATMAIAFTDTDTTGTTMGDTTTVAGLPDKKLGVPIIINTETVGSNHFATVFLG